MVSSHGKSSQLVTCACVLGMLTNPQYQSAFLKFGLGLALNTMSSSFRKLAGGQLYSCPVSWEASIRQRCSYKCHSLNGNAAGHVVLPGDSKSKEKHSAGGKTNFFLPALVTLNSGTLKIRTRFQELVLHYNKCHHNPNQNLLPGWLA